MQSSAQNTQVSVDKAAEALAAVNSSEERMYEAELYRLKGELTLQEANQKSKGKSQKSKKIKSQKSKVKNQKSKFRKKSPFIGDICLFLNFDFLLLTSHPSYLCQNPTHVHTPLRLG